jgi:Na+-transporting NADH:ubiquinone oxidoreductase subunit C
VLNKDTVGGTLSVALILCVVCSIVVASSAVLLRPMQQANKDLDRKTNILSAAGLLKEGASVDSLFEGISVRAVDLDSGQFTDSVDLENYDQRKASKDPALSEELSASEDLAKISRRANVATVYIVENSGGIEKVILPIKGYGLWSTLYGFIALEGDLNTVAGLGFYEHAETPGLGGEVDNPLWKAKWEGKKVFDDEGKTALRVIKGPVDSNRAGSEYQIDGLSGATLTSRGVSQLIQFWLGENGFAPFLTKLKEGEA